MRNRSTRARAYLTYDWDGEKLIRHLPNRFPFNRYANGLYPAIMAVNVNPSMAPIHIIAGLKRLIEEIELRGLPVTRHPADTSTVASGQEKEGGNDE